MELYGPLLNSIQPWGRHILRVLSIFTVSSFVG